MEEEMRAITGLTAMLLLALQSPSAKAGEAFVTQAATAKTSITGARSPTGGTWMSAMLASPLSAFEPATQPAAAGGAGNVSNLSQYGADNFAAVAQSGAANRSAVTQHGSGNAAMVSQRGGTH
jgi:Curlin associated repeat